MTDTPALTAADRAKEICDVMDAETSAKLTGDDWATLERLIASAIREAEDAAYERAAVLAGKEAEALDRVAPFYRPPFAEPDEQVAVLHEQGAVVARNLLTDIRALKSQKETP